MDFCNREIGLRTSKMSFFTLQKHRFCILKAMLLHPKIYAFAVSKLCFCMLKG